MKNALYIVLTLSLLSACSSVPVSEQIAKQAKSDLKTVESILTDVKSSIPTECKNLLENDLNQVFVQIKEIDNQISASVDACSIEKEILETKISVRNLIIGLLCMAIAGLVFIKIKA